MERFMHSDKTELAHRMIFFGKRALDYATNGYLDHDHTLRNHQGLGNQLIDPPPEVASINLHGEIEKREHLGGLLRGYVRSAA